MPTTRHVIFFHLVATYYPDLADGSAARRPPDIRLQPILWRNLQQPRMPPGTISQPSRICSDGEIAARR